MTKHFLVFVGKPEAPVFEIVPILTNEDLGGGEVQMVSRPCNLFVLLIST